MPTFNVTADGNAKCDGFTDDSNSLKRHKKRNFIKVLVFDIVTNTQIREHKVDFSDGRKRKWLCGLIVWATSNQKSIEIEAIV
jgi:hypothetical protein